MTFFVRLAFVATGLLAACGGKIGSGDDAGSDGAPPPPPLTDAQPPPPWDGGPPPIPDGGQCNAVPLIGPVVTMNQVPANPPSFPSGGSPIFQGVYALIGLTAYTGPGGSSTPLGTAQVSIQISGANNGFDLQVAAAVTNQPLEHSSSVATILGPNQLSISSYCPQTSTPSPAAYYFDGSTLWLRASGNGSNFVVDEQFSLMTN